MGLHHGSAISPLLFIIIMDVLASEIDTKPSWAMLFADDLVLCETSKAAVQRELDIMARPIRKAWTERQPDKTAYTPCNEYNNNFRNYEEIQLGDYKLNTVTTLKYLGSILEEQRGT